MSARCDTRPPDTGAGDTRALDAPTDGAHPATTQVFRVFADGTWVAVDATPLGPSGETQETISARKNDLETVGNHLPRPLALATAANAQILPGGTAIHDPVPEGEEEEMELALDELRNDRDTAKSSWADIAERRAAHKRLQPFMSREDHEKLGRHLPAREWKDAPTRALSSPRTMLTTRDTRCATGKRVHAFGGAARSSASSGNDDGGSDPPDLPRLAPLRRLEPPAYPETARPIDRRTWPWYLAPGHCVDYDEAVRHALHYGRVLEQIGGLTLAIHGRWPLTDAGGPS